MYEIDNVKWYDGDYDPDPCSICTTDTETARGKPGHSARTTYWTQAAILWSVGRAYGTPVKGYGYRPLSARWVE